MDRLSNSVIFSDDTAPPVETGNMSSLCRLHHSPGLHFTRVCLTTHHRVMCAIDLSPLFILLMDLFFPQKVPVCMWPCFVLSVYYCHALAHVGAGSGRGGVLALSLGLPGRGADLLEFHVHRRGRGSTQS